MITPLSVIVPMSADPVEFSKHWTKFWGSVSGTMGGLVTLMGIIGVLMVVAALGMWIYRKSRGGGGNTSGLVWTIVVGGILAAPTVLIPILLKLVDFLINTVTAVLNTASKG